MQNTNLAKIQFNCLSNMTPTIAQEFCIYRYKKIINEEFFNFDDDNLNLDIASTIAFDQSFKKFKKHIEKVGILYIDFWNTLIQDDMSKLLILLK